LKEHTVEYCTVEFRKHLVKLGKDIGYHMAELQLEHNIK
jgi:hypothetical protein